LELMAERKASTEAVLEQIQMWTEKYNRVSKVWQYQSMNKLDLVAAQEGFGWNVDDDVVGKNGSKEDAQDTRFYRASNAWLAHLLSSFGDARQFLDEGLVSEELLIAASQQMKSSIERYADLANAKNFVDIFKHWECFFSIVRIRIRSATQVKAPRGSSKGMFEAHVVIRVDGKSLKDCQHTLVVRDTTCPVWEQDFYVHALKEDGFRLEVYFGDPMKMDYYQQQKQGIGYVQVDAARQQHGHWVERTDGLLNIDTKEKTGASLEYAFFFATGITQLEEMEKYTPSSLGDNEGVLKSVSRFLA